jgi:hypothetical protein
MIGGASQLPTLSKNEPLSQFQTGLLYQPYFKELADATNGLPGHEHLLEELESLRKRLTDVLRQIRCADKNQLKVLSDKLANELLTTGGQLPAIRHMSQASIWLSAAAEADKKATTTEGLLRWNELSKAVRNSKSEVTKVTHMNLNPFILDTFRRTDWLDKWMGKEITAAARSTTSDVRRALRRTRFLASVRWLVPHASYIGWSLVGCVIIIDYFQGFANKEIVDFLSRYFGGASQSLESWSKIVLLVVAWLIVDRCLTPYLGRWQERLERREIGRFASDVVNASFQVRIYRALVYVAFFNALSFAFPSLESDRSWLKYFLQWDVPTIEALEGLGPLTSLQ